MKKSVNSTRAHVNIYRNIISITNKLAYNSNIKKLNVGLCFYLHIYDKLSYGIEKIFLSLIYKI